LGWAEHPWGRDRGSTLLAGCLVITASPQHPQQCMTYAGTVTYMSPERLEGRPYNFTADVWCVRG
jgi:serine/threonine protein kinase